MTIESIQNIRPTIKIDGEENADLQTALKAFVINLPLSGTSHGEITATNWINNSENGELGFGFQEAGLGKSIEILMGEDNQTPIFSGEITAVEERYGEGGPQIILLVQDKIHILARQRENRVFEEMSPDDIVNEIASELGLTADVNVSTAVANYHQLNESNLAFLMRILNSFGVAVRIEENNLRVKAEEPDSEPVELSTSDSALKVRLIADLNHQPSQITVKGFNPDNNEVVSHDASELDLPADGKTAKDLADELSWPGENIVPQPFPRTQSEAESLAKSHFTRQAKRFISGDVQCMGEPSLKSGKEINLSGVSARFQGKYQVVHCTHCFSNQSGFETHLKINRPDGVG
ncbi:hypothetical protein FLL45_20325 [Aliikangiella marina]|uniref:Phage late control D family protein n=1 Tax=Aliikangiella marina TaxID=1712262 RepID=A0A545T2R6_9GAMM|nr:contractile injection system protein, VgrG/Pvc8 family [Aliikangiella marina]TQV71502.1 hypothetical protein FLL45_20325 [Aliikangiella marina]